KLGGFQRSEADEDVHDAEVDVVLGRRLPIALHEIRLARRTALKCALAEQVVHERADIHSDLSPERLVVGLEHDPLRAAIQTLLEKESDASHRDIFPFRGK